MTHLRFECAAVADRQEALTASQLHAVFRDLPLHTSRAAIRKSNHSCAKTTTVSTQTVLPWLVGTAVVRYDCCATRTI